MFPWLALGHGRSPRGAAEPAWAPSDETGLVLWLKDTSIVGDPGVSEWSDLSASNADFVQAVEALQPTLSTLNSRAAVLGNGSTHFLAAVSDVSFAADFEALFAFTTSSSTSYWISALDGTSGFRLGATGGLSVRIGGALTALTGAGGAGFAASTTWVASVSRDGDDLFAVERNGTVITSGTPTVSGTWAAGSLFGSVALASFSPITLGEILLYDHKLATEDRASATAYLQGRWQ